MTRNPSTKAKFYAAYLTQILSNGTFSKKRHVVFVAAYRLSEAKKIALDTCKNSMNSKKYVVDFVIEVLDVPGTDGFFEINLIPTRLNDLQKREPVL